MEISPLYDKKVTCIHCKGNFTTTRIRSRFVRVSSHESDFKPVYSDTKVFITLPSALIVASLLPMISPLTLLLARKKTSLNG